MTTDELIAQVLEHDSKATAGPWKVSDEIPEDGALAQVFVEVLTPDGMETDCQIAIDLSNDDAALAAYYRTVAPLLARKLQRAMEVLRAASESHFSAALPDDFDETQPLSLPVFGPFDAVLADIEAMQ